MGNYKGELEGGLTPKAPGENGDEWMTRRLGKLRRVESGLRRNWLRQQEEDEGNESRRRRRERKAFWMADRRRAKCTGGENES
ncbi:hypothetical protein FCM35_KLT19019 [Carex littledalei]|uniref:Uncharacterized protein n=1 Tax=Carex littledalei TaxID=544730 RepID=A0A833VV31_9POAL|nr:hypothetical protein FCM35_KLT19019 [Carex littledalei]